MKKAMLLLILILIYSCTEDKEYLSIKYENKKLLSSEILVNKDESIFEINDAFQDNLIVIPVSVNGKTYRFSVDTGVPYSSSISKKFMEENSLIMKDKLVASGSGFGASSYSEVIEGCPMKIGPFTVIHDTFIYIPNAENYLINRNIDGILGTRFLQYFKFIIDVKEKRVKFSIDASIDVDSIDLSNRRPKETVFQAVFDGIKYNVLLDTGNVGIGVFPVYYDWKKYFLSDPVRVVYAKEDKYIMDLEGRKSKIVSIVRVQDIEIGKFRLKNQYFLVAENKSNLNALNISLDSVRDTSIIINYPNRKILFKTENDIMMQDNVADLLPL